MVSTDSQSVASLGNLLTQAGARPSRYGKKWDCPACGKPGCLSVDESRGLFNCFGAGCDFRGNTTTLRRRLGIASPKLSSLECQRLMAMDKKLDERVARLLEAKHDRRDKVIDSLMELYRLEGSAHVAGPDNPAAWDALADVYARRQRLEAELLILNHAHARDLERFLVTSSSSDRTRAIDNVFMLGGLADAKGRWVPMVTQDIVEYVSVDGESRKE